MSRDVEIHLTHPGWAASGATWARGYAHVGNRSLTSIDIAAALDACPSDKGWEALLGSLNGCFAAITQRDAAVIAAVDRIRSIPLFHAVVAGRCLLSDSAHRIFDAADDWAIDPVADAEFQHTGYVTGSGTLLPQLHQVQAGELVRWGPGAPADGERRRHYRSRHVEEPRPDVGDLVTRLDRVHGNVFRRLLQGTQDRPIVLALSGGYDSRLIGVSLRDLGARDVVCYSYGLPGNWEARISQELARYLGFRWEFVAYSAERWRAWAASQSFASYFRSAGNLSSIPHVQDWPAVAELHRERKIDTASVFVPGHSGDFVAGSHIPPVFLKTTRVSRRTVLDSVLRSHYSLWRSLPDVGAAESPGRFDARIEAVVGAVHDCSSAEAADLFERWDLQERQAKFICNSVRAYEAFGHDWRLPLFDHELMDFWARVPLDLRFGRKLYFQFARERQELPVTAANVDRPALLRAVIGGLATMRLTGIARHARRRYLGLRWRREYERSALGWLAMVDRDFFARTYSGEQLFHSYIALAYRDWVLASTGRDAGRPPVIPALVVR